MKTDYHRTTSGHLPLICDPWVHRPLLPPVVAAHMAYDRLPRLRAGWQSTAKDHAGRCWRAASGKRPVKCSFEGVGQPRTGLGRRRVVACKKQQLGVQLKR